jgi:hypothetical protein
MEKDALISPNKIYRYTLRRVWDNTKPDLIWIMLNPSTADAEKDDATIRRCIGFSQRFEYGGLVVVNLFAWRSSKPVPQSHWSPPYIGPANDHHILQNCLNKTVVCAWGAGGPQWRVNEVRMLTRA